jgi:hypothetical protein
MPNVAPIRFTDTFHMRCDEEFLADLDDLRVRERPVLSRGELIRRLVKEAKERAGRRKQA